jgi:capsular polysaccharide biosynthesis protein
MPTMQSIVGNADWLTVKEALAYGKISRSRLYALIADKEVRTVSIKRRGKVRGKRYVSRTSIDELFESTCVAQCNN